MIAFLFLLIILGGGWSIVERAGVLSPMMIAVGRLVVVVILLWFALAAFGLAPAWPRP